MGLFDQLGGLLGGAQGGEGQAGGGGAFGAITGMLENHPGGIGGLVQAFQEHGLGGVAQSWVGDGTNAPISADQITQVLGDGPVAQFAEKLGISPADAASHLSELLPQVVNHLTPNGETQPGALGALEGLLGTFRK